VEVQPGPFALSLAVFSSPSCTLLEPLSGGLEARGKVDGNIDKSFEINGSLGKDCSVVPFEILHGDKRVASYFTNVINRANVGMS
jgi:hypothetical protein